MYIRAKSTKLVIPATAKVEGRAISETSFHHLPESPILEASPERYFLLKCTETFLKLKKIPHSRGGVRSTYFYVNIEFCSI